MTTLCGLYIAQGIPWGFVTVTFAAWLAQPKHNLTVAQLGPMLAVATLPWSFKFLWGPMMDRFTIRRFGRRRPWIIFSQSMAILTLGGMVLVNDLPGMVWTESPGDGAMASLAYRFVPGPLAAIILLANVFVSMQDVAVDALAVDLLAEEERGTANGLMYGSSYLGTAIGGAGLGFVVSRYGIQAGLFGQAMLLFLIMLLPILIRERPEPRKRSDATDTEEESIPVIDGAETDRVAAVDFGETPFLPPSDVSSHAAAMPDASRRRESVFMNLIRAFRIRAAWMGALVALSVKIGIGVLTAVFVDHLQKEGGWTQDQYTSVMGGYAVMLGLIGSALGGFVADKVGPKPMIAITSMLLGATWILFGLSAGLLDSKTSVTVLLLAQEFLLAVMTVSLFTMFMGISWPRVAATQFTAYMALMNLSTTIGSYAAGILSRDFGILQILVIAGVTQIVLILPVFMIDLTQTRRVLGNE